MLAVMRKYFKKLSWTLWLVIFSFVGTIFLVWGRGSDQSAVNGDLDAIVYEHQISKLDVARMAQVYRDHYRQMYGDNFDRVEGSLNFQEIALNGLIERAFYLREAKKQNIDVSEEEVTRRITSSPGFQDNGIFNPRIYRIFLERSPWRSASVYESFMRDSLIVERVVNNLKNVVKVSREEIRAEYQRKSERRTISFVGFFSRDAQGEIQPEETVLREYFEKNKDTYQIPDKLKVKYVFLDKNRMKETVSFDPGVLEEYYEDHISEYSEPEKVSAKHILIKMERDASEEEQNKALSRIQQIKKEIADGLSFEDAAKKYSDDPQSGKEGGDLGSFTKEMMVPAFGEAAFSLEPGIVSEPVKSVFGYHLIKVYEKTPSVTRSFEDVKSSIEDTLKTEEVEQRADDLIYEIENILFDEEPDMKKVSERFNLQYGETGFFAVDDVIDGIEGSKEFAQAAFATYALTGEPGEISEAVKTANGYYIVSPVELQKQRPATFEDVKDKVREEYIREQSVKIAEKKAQDFHQKVTESGKWDDVIEEMGLTAETSAPFGRGGYIAKMGRSEEVEQFVFKNDVNAIGPAVRVRDDFYVYKIVDKKDFDQEGFEKEFNVYYTSLMNEKQQKYLTNWIEQQKESAQSEGKLVLYSDTKS